MRGSPIKSARLKSCAALAHRIPAAPSFASAWLAIPLLSLLLLITLLPGPSPAATATWTQTAAGTHSWNVNTNPPWDTALFPNAIDDVANLNINIAGNQTINLNQAIIVGTLNIGDTSGGQTFAINPNGGSLTFDVSAGNAVLNKVAGGGLDTFNTGITLNDTTDVTTGTASLTFAVAIGGSGGINLLAGTDVTFNVANTYLGTTVIDGSGSGRLRINNAAGLGSTAAGTTVNATGRLHMNANITFNAEPLTLNGGSLWGQNGQTPTWTGLITLTADSAVKMDNSGTLNINPAAGNAIDLQSFTLTFAGRNISDTVDDFDPNFTVHDPIIGTGGVTFQAGTFLTLSGINTYSGDTTISRNILRADDTVGLPNASFLILNSTDAGRPSIWETGANIARTTDTVAGAGKVNVTNNSGFSALGGAVNVNLNGGAGLTWGSTAGFNPSVLTLQSGSANNALNFQNDIDLNGAVRTVQVISTAVAAPATMSGDLSNGGLNKTGNGVLVLSGQNTYTGTTTFTAGRLNVGSAENAGVSGPLGTSPAANPGSIVLNNGYLQYSAANQFDYSGRFSTAANQRYNVDTNGQNVTWATPLTSTGGTLIKDGNGTLTVSSTGSTFSTATLNAGVLNMTGTGTITSIVAANTIVGNGWLEIAPGANYSATSLTVTNRGIAHMTGGQVTTTGDVFVGGTGANATEYMYLSGGTLSAGGNAFVGGNNGNNQNDQGNFIMSGGSFTVTGTMRVGTSHNSGGNTLAMGSGTTTVNGSAITLAGSSRNPNNSWGRIFLAGDSVLAAQQINRNTPNTPGFGESTVYFNGGTLKALADNANFLGPLLIPANGNTAIGSSTENFVRVYAGGATIDTNGFDATVNPALLAHTSTANNGIDSASLVNLGSGYSIAPNISFSGGGGSGATAVAALGANGTIDAIIITNPGAGYTSTPTVNISGGTLIPGGIAANNAGASVSMIAANSGGLTKEGAGTLTLMRPNTYTGLTDIQAGILALGASSSISTSSGIDIAAGAELDTTALSFTMLASQPFTFDIDPSGVGLMGLLDAAGLDITLGDVTFNPTGVLDDPVYIFANYTSLTGTMFASAIAPAGYLIDYNYLGGNQIALVQETSVIPEPSTIALAGLGLIGLGIAGIRRRCRLRV